MSKFMLSSKTISNISKYTGISEKDLMKLTSEEQTEKIEEKIGKKLQHSTYDKNPVFVGRGSVYLYLRRILKSSYIEKEICKI
jgi:hypothetical protein